MEEKIQKVAEDFLERIKKNLPTDKADKPFIVGIVGMIGSGRTLLAKTLINYLKGAVLVSGNSARFLLKQEGMPWGENVQKCIFHATRWLIKEGYIVIYDGSQVDKEKRIKTQELADELGVKYYLLRILTSQETAEKYLRKKYSQPHENTFEDFWPGTDAEDIVQNLKERNKVYNSIDQEEPKPEFFAEIENEGTIDEFKQKAIEVAKRLEQQ